MIELAAQKSELEAARLVANNAQLVNIFLARANVAGDSQRRLKTPVNADLRQSLAIMEPSYELVSERILLIEAGIKIDLEHVVDPEGHDQENQDEESQAVIEVVYSLAYQLPPPPIPESIQKDGFPAFAKLNGPYNAWPYLRSQVQQLSAAMGIPIMLPLLNIREKQDNSSDQHDN